MPESSTNEKEEREFLKFHPYSLQHSSTKLNLHLLFQLLPYIDHHMDAKRLIYAYYISPIHAKKRANLATNLTRISLIAPTSKGEIAYPYPKGDMV